MGYNWTTGLQEQTMKNTFCCREVTTLKGQNQRETLAVKLFSDIEKTPFSKVAFLIYYKNIGL